MRNSLLILVLALAAGCLLWLVVEQEPAPAAREDGGEGPLPERQARAATPLTVDRLASVEVVAGGLLPDDLDDVEASPPPPSDARFRRVEVRMPSGEPWLPTGARVLEILRREMARKTPIRFRDQASLDAFRARVWPHEFPPEFPLWMLVESCHEAGFRPVLRADAVYILPIEGP